MDIQKYKFIQANNEELWKKEIKHVLKRDIHEHSLGCCVDDTHIKVGDVHIGEFYEAQILFGNAYWISIFSNALKKEIESFAYKKKEKILIIGYETYIEPVLLQLKELLNNNNYNIDFCIYEEAKFILKNEKSTARFRFGTTANIKDYKNIIIVCGISSTLSTYKKIISKISKDKKATFTEVASNTKCISIIQTLPQKFDTDNSFYLRGVDDENDKLVHIASARIFSRVFNTQESITTNYLVEIYCEWQRAESCKWCYDEEYERPIIATNESSVIPVQMIGANHKKDINAHNNMKSVDYLNFFQKTASGSFLYSDYLYYNHIERDSHHFQYYIRTNSLLKAIVSIKEEQNKLCNFCDNIRDILLKKNKKRIDVIIVPIHYSNEHFLSIIARKVFHNSAEIINFDPQKEFRSNFETKYSNYTYVLDNIKCDETKVYFHYLDDQIITGSTFYKAKSFVVSLIANSGLFNSVAEIQSSVPIFESIITLIDRNSESSRYNYISDLRKYFSLINISVPSFRNHGDSCYLCSKSETANLIKSRAALWNMEKYWEEKENYHCVKTLDQTKRKKEEQAEYISERKFRQFYCENLIWSLLKNNWQSDKIVYQEIIKLIASEIQRKSRNEQYEYVISFVKVMSKPFIYYRENVKKAVFSILSYMIYILNKNAHIMPSSIIHILREIPYGLHANAYLYMDNEAKSISNRKLCNNCECEKYYLYVMLLSRLSSINSTYLIKVQNIVKALDFYHTLFGEIQELPSGIIPIQEYIYPYIKLVTNGISGHHKAKYLDNEIKKIQFDKKYQSVFERIYLENLEACRNEQSDIDFYNGCSTRDKYRSFLSHISPNNDAYLVTKLDNNIFTIAKYIGQSDNSDAFDAKVLAELHFENKDVYFSSDMIYIKCYSAEDTCNHIYLVVRYSSSNVGQKIDFEKLKFTRSILNTRYKLSNELSKDISSGAIEELCQDDKLIELFAQPKVISHGQSEDIKEHLNCLERKFKLYKSHDESISFDFLNIDSELTLFGNLIISLFYTKKMAEERGYTHKFKELLTLTKMTSISKVKSISEVKQKTKTLFFDEPEEELIQENLYKLFSERLLHYKQSMEHLGIEIILKTDELNVINGIISLHHSDENSIWFAITIIHILVKNAVKHGDKQNPILIELKRSNTSFDLIIKNQFKNKLSHSVNGITQKALQYAFGESESDIVFDPNNESNEFTVIISDFME